MWAEYCSDGDCPNWQSLSLYSHTIATAEKAGQLQAFVQWYQQDILPPKITGRNQLGLRPSHIPPPSSVLPNHLAAPIPLQEKYIHVLRI